MWNCFVLLFLVGALSSKYELLPYDPVADPAATVVYGLARFTVLTDSLIRVEYNPTGKFEDRATLAFLNRKLPVPAYTKSIANGILTLTTSRLVLKYQIGQPFSSTTLTITSATFSWHYGYNANGNNQSPRVLFGTIKSLDEIDSGGNLKTLNCSQISGMKIHDESLHCEYGLISRDGWVVVNDADNYVLDSADWWEGTNSDQVDLYFFGHGLRYTDALKDFTAVGGKIAMVPKYITGIWWSRWYDLDNSDVKGVVNMYKTLSFPLDVYVLDMDWHTKYGWGGYSWDKNLFPIPQSTTEWLHDQGLHLTANLHDADGVRPTEDQYKEMAAALGINNGLTIPFASCSNSSIAYALEDIVLSAVEASGMDFWWIDWQQGGNLGGCAGGKQNPTIWLSKLRGTDHIRHSDVTRAVVLGRWGGFGTHRYQVGFSGDVARLTWQNLALQPYFSYTASNVGYGFWSHDLVGPYNDHDLHTRWLQWGAYSAVFRTHDRGMAVGGCNSMSPSTCAIVEPWNVPQKYLLLNREAMLGRSRLIPYIYTAYRQAFDTGVSPLRPMYYSYPSIDAAYAGTITGKYPQYMFGDHLLVSPIVTPANTTTFLTEQTVWIPPGNWFDIELGRLVSGGTSGTSVRTSYDISEVPVFTRPGTVIPGIEVETGDTIGLAQRQYTNLALTVYPGGGSVPFVTRVYEDDGQTTGYATGAFTWTNISTTVNGGVTQVTVYQTPGQPFPEFPTARSYTLRFVASLPPLSISVNGQPVGYSRVGGVNTWHYDAKSLTVVVQTTVLPTNENVVVQIIVDTKGPSLVGLKGYLVRASKAKAILDLTNSAPGTSQVQPAHLSIVASTIDNLEYIAGQPSDNGHAAFEKVVQSVSSWWQLAVNEVRAIEPPKGTPQHDQWAHAFNLLTSL